MNRCTVFDFAQFTNFDNTMIVDISVISNCPTKLTEMNFLNLGVGVPEFTKISIHIFTITLKNKLVVLSSTVGLCRAALQPLQSSYLHELVECQNKQVDQPMEILGRIRPRGECDPRRYHKYGRLLN